MNYEEMLKTVLVNEGCYSYCKHNYNDINYEYYCKYDNDCHRDKNFKHFKVDPDKFNKMFGIK